MAIDPPLRSEKKPTKTTPVKSAQNGLPTHSGQEDAGTKSSPGIPSGIIVEALKATNIFYRRSLRTCHHQW
jgi:hypothetical protein